MGPLPPCFSHRSKNSAGAKYWEKPGWLSAYQIIPGGAGIVMSRPFIWMTGVLPEAEEEPSATDRKTGIAMRSTRRMRPGRVRDGLELLDLGSCMAMKATLRLPPTPAPSHELALRAVSARVRSHGSGTPFGHARQPAVRLLPRRPPGSGSMSRRSARDREAPILA